MYERERRERTARITVGHVHDFIQYLIVNEPHAATAFAMRSMAASRISSYHKHTHTRTKVYAHIHTDNKYFLIYYEKICRGIGMANFASNHKLNCQEFLTVSQIVSNFRH